MARKRDGRKKTLSEHLAARARAAEESKAREEARAQSIAALRKLDAEVLCDCPACRRRRGITLQKS